MQCFRCPGRRRADRARSEIPRPPRHCQGRAQWRRLRRKSALPACACVRPPPSPLLLGAMHVADLTGIVAVILGTMVGWLLAGIFANVAARFLGWSSSSDPERTFTFPFTPTRPALPVPRLPSANSLASSIREKVGLVFRATKQHASNLARFAIVYKTTCMVLKYLADGKEGEFISAL